MSRKHKHLYKKTSVYTSFNVYSCRKPATTQEAYVLECWKQTSNAWVQATESESWRTKPISRSCSGHSAKTRTLKTSCVLRPLECMHPAKWRLLRTIDYSHYSNWNDIIQPIDEYIISMSMRSHMCKLKFKTRMANTQFCRQQKTIFILKTYLCWSDGSRSSIIL